MSALTIAPRLQSYVSSFLQQSGGLPRMTRRRANIKPAFRRGANPSGKRKSCQLLQKIPKTSPLNDTRHSRGKSGVRRPQMTELGLGRQDSSEAEERSNAHA